ncbi:MAG: hypothetical protein M1819_000667 [Sarea resinae]|nr:MAG: hypothetical protein M1819_000667 [Sarea resinae]
MTSDLSILSAEMYDDSHIIKQREFFAERASKMNLYGGFVLEESPRTGSDSSAKHNPETTSRKRAHLEEDDDTSSKKQRGRPRLGDKDETAAERRRTQIRIAQRAYRQRKETTISSLNNKVENLENIIAEMNVAFMKFNDAAMASDIFQLRPQLARTLKETTQKFISLIPASGLESETSDDSHESSRRSSSGSKDAEDATRTRRRSRKSKNSPELEPESNVLATVDSYEKSQKKQSRERGVRAGSEILAFDGSQFTSPEFNLVNPDPDAVFQSAEYTWPTNAYGQALIPSPKKTSLPGPYTFSFQETTFARRLHRATIETGYHLLSNSATPPELIDRIFKVALLRFPRDQILDCLRNALLKSNEESFGKGLNWPCVGGAGAGNHFPRHPQTAAWANGKPNSIGPVARKQLEIAAANGIADIPETEGEWFDAEDVEGYLRHRGIFLDGRSSFVEARMRDSEDPASVYHPLTSDSIVSSGSPSSTSSLSDRPRSTGLEDLDPISEDVSSANATPPLSHSLPYSPHQTTGTTMSIDSFNSSFSGSVPFSQQDHLPVTISSSMASALSSLSPLSSLSDLSNPWALSDFDLGGLDMAFAASSPLAAAAAATTTTTTTTTTETAQPGTKRIAHTTANAAASPTSRSTNILLDVDRLVKEIIHGSVCLGGTPGYRRRDVDRALAVAVVGF